MKQLTFKDLIKVFDELKKDNSIEEIVQMPIYIGDDDELNGIHCAWNCEKINNEDKDVVEMINSNCCNNKLKGKAILIS